MRKNAKLFTRFRSGDLCPYCEQPMRWTSFQNFPTREHRIPISRGGPKTGPNVFVACHQCNQTKGSMTEEEFRDWIKLGRPNKREYLRSIGLPVISERRPKS